MQLVAETLCAQSGIRTQKPHGPKWLGFIGTQARGTLRIASAGRRSWPAGEAAQTLVAGSGEEDVDGRNAEADADEDDGDGTTGAGSALQEQGGNAFRLTLLAHFGQRSPGQYL